MEGGAGGAGAAAGAAGGGGKAEVLDNITLRPADLCFVTAAPELRALTQVCCPAGCSAARWAQGAGVGEWGPGFGVRVRGLEFGE